jgi:Domain of unknown function (DUF4382)
MKTKTWVLGAVSALAAATLVACGGGGSSSDGPATLRLFLTDAPACGYDNVWVTVDKVRVHQSASAGDSDGGWVEMDVAPDRRVDLLTLTNGTLEPLGQMQLEAGTYTQMRLVLAPNSASAPLANAIKPTGAPETALTTPSGQQSGLKMNVNLTLNPDTVADFAIDFDACKSFVKAGNSGKYILKPVLSVIPILSSKIIGYVDPALAFTSTNVSAQQDGVPLKATPPDATGRFELFPIRTGTYDLVITAPGYVNAVMTGVPVTAAGATTIGSTALRLVPPASPASAAASGVITLAGSTADTNGAVRALQILSSGTKMEVAYAAADAASGVYSLSLPTGAPALVAYAASAASFPFAGDAAQAARYRLEALAGTATTPLVQDVVIPATVNFVFP